MPVALPRPAVQQHHHHHHQQQQGSGRGKTCPSPIFDARSLRNAKWSSNEDVSSFGRGGRGSSGGGSGADSPFLKADKRRDFKPVNFDSNSLKRNNSGKENVSGNSQNSQNVNPKDSFAWKDKTLDVELKALRDARSKKVETRDGGHLFDQGIQGSLASWNKLPKAPDQEVILLKKAREEKKVRRYLDDNFTNRPELISPNPDHKDDHEAELGSLKKQQYKGTGPKTRDGSASGYASEPELGRVTKTRLGPYKYEEAVESTGTPPRSPPPFSKHESRFEREQRIRVGPVDSYKPGSGTAGSLLYDDRDRALPPPQTSSAQRQYEKERFKVQPGSIKDYSLGRGSLANRERQQGAIPTSPSIKKFHMQSALRDGYESDSSALIRKRDDIPSPRTQTPDEAKLDYNRIQRGGDIPHYGLRMSAPDRAKDAQAVSRYAESEVNIHYRAPIRAEVRDPVPEEELKRRQEEQMRQFYLNIEQRKEEQMREDRLARMHHDTLLPNQKSPVPLNRYADVNGHQEVVTPSAGTPNSTLRSNQGYKMVTRALYNFQPQNHRELGFKKGDIIYVKRQVDSNWYEGERNAMIGIFPTTYVEVIPEGEVSSLRSNKRTAYTAAASPSSSQGQQEGQGKVKFNFHAQTPMELSLVKGEMVTLTRRIDRNWFDGRIGNRKGIFPVSYVDVICEPGITRTRSPPKPVSAPAAHSHLKDAAPLSHYVPPDLNINAPIRDQQQQQQQRSSSTGMAQQHFSQSSSTTTKTTKMMSSSSQQKEVHTVDARSEPMPYRALYNYKPHNDDEVELAEGDLLYVMEMCDDGWFVGTSQRTGIFGTFPGNYVERAA